MEGISEYQTLIAGIAAIVAAGFSVWIIYEQIKQTERLERERRERSNSAARAVLPHALRTITDYTKECTDILLVIYNANSDRRDKPCIVPETGIRQFPEPSTEAIAILRENIEAARDSKTREKLRLLISDIQIQNSRVTRTRKNLISASRSFSIATRV
jgi:hypothetical protein